MSEMMPGEVLLVNLETGECIKADHYRLVELGIPEGYVEAENVTTEKWCAIMQNKDKY